MMPGFDTWRALGAATVVAALIYGCASRGPDMADLLWQAASGDRMVHGAEAGAATGAVVGARF